MDFRSLSRRELQSLCKLNKIPANTTNISMADALQSLEIVVGIEDFLNVSQSETTTDVAESVEVFSPKAPHTRCRTSTRQRVNPTETGTATVTRTTRRGSKQQPPREEDQRKTESSVGRKAPRTASRRNVNDQLDAAAADTKYGTRRSTRLTEKKPTSVMNKGVEKPDSFLDETSKQHQENYIRTTEVGDLCDAFENVVVIASHKAGEGDEDSDKMNIQKQESDGNTTNAFEDDFKMNNEVKPESDPCQHSSGDDEVVQASDETTAVGSDDAKLGHEDTLCAEGLAINNHVLQINVNETESVVEEEVEEDMEPELLTAANNVNNKSGIESGMDQSLSDVVKNMTEAAEELTENDVSDADSTPAQSPLSLTDHLTHVTEKVEDLKPEFITENHVNEKSDSEYGPLPNPLILSDVTGHPTHMTPIKNMTEEVEDLKLEIFINNNVNEKSDSESGPTQNPLILTVVTGHLTHVTSEVEDLKPELVTENNAHEKSDAESAPANVNKKYDAESGLAQNPLILADVTGHVARVTSEVEDLKPELVTENNAHEKSDAESGPTQNPLILTDVTGHLTRVTSEVAPLVSDDKENMVDEAIFSKKEKDDEGEKMGSLHEMSIRQLKKQLKALTLKTLNSKEEGGEGGTRHALQALSENQAV